jgi:hypothetical protein
MSDERSDPGVGPFAELLGARRAHMGEGICRFELAAESRHLNPTASSTAASCTRSWTTPWAGR